MTDRLQQIKETWWWGGERGVRPLSGPHTEWLINEVERLREILVEIREIILRGGSD